MLAKREVATAARGPAIFPVQSPCSMYVWSVCPRRDKPAETTPRNSTEAIDTARIFSVIPDMPFDVCCKSRFAQARCRAEVSVEGVTATFWKVEGESCSGLSP